MAAQFAVEAERGNWSGTGDAAAVLAIMEGHLPEADQHLAEMSLGIIGNQMANLEIGDMLAYNWACSVLDVKVTRVG